MVCLLETREVVCFHHDANFRITFTTPRILSGAFPFRPPQATLKPAITKVTSSGTTFAALSAIGDVFTFSLPNPLEDVSKEARDRHVTVKPQLIWALRKRFTAVKDVALGSDGTVIICTHAGHVYVRSRVKASGGLKFKHVPYLQRVVKVATNESGAFAAIRVNAHPRPIKLGGRTLQEDMALLLPHHQRFEHQVTAEDFMIKGEEEEEEEGADVARDITTAVKLCTILQRWRDSDTDSLFSWSEPLLGSDLRLVVGDIAIPAHSLILSLRVPALAAYLKSKGGKLDRFITNGGDISVDVCHPMVVLLLLQYIYADEVPALWDSRVARIVQTKFADLALPVGQIKADLAGLASVLSLSPLAKALESAGKTTVSRSLSADLKGYFDRTSGGKGDVVLCLADKQVHCSSIILRSRCPFFEAMFGDADWTASRVEQGTVTVKMEHLKWRPMKLVFKWIHEGDEDELFDYLREYARHGARD